MNMKRNTSLWTQDEAARMSPAGWMALGIGVLVVVAVGSVPAPEILRAEPAPDLFQSLPNRFPLVPYNLLRHSPVLVQLDDLFSSLLQAESAGGRNCAQPLRHPLVTGE